MLGLARVEVRSIRRRFEPIYIRWNAAEKKEMAVSGLPIDSQSPCCQAEALMRGDGPVSIGLEKEIPLF